MVFPIELLELELLGFLMLAISLLMSSYSYALNPGNSYILSSQAAVISLLLYFTKEIIYGHLSKESFMDLKNGRNLTRCRFWAIQEIQMLMGILALTSSFPAYFEHCQVKKGTIQWSVKRVYAISGCQSVQTQIYY